MTVKVFAIPSKYLKVSNFRTPLEAYTRCGWLCFIKDHFIPSIIPSIKSTLVLSKQLAIVKGVKLIWNNRLLGNRHIEAFSKESSFAVSMLSWITNGGCHSQTVRQSIKTFRKLEELLSRRIALVGSIRRHTGISLDANESFGRFLSFRRFLPFNL